MGICVPWDAAHVHSGGGDRKLWQEHLLYLEALQRIMELAPSERCMVIGDFNQKVPRTRAHRHVYSKLEGLCNEKFRLVTKGSISEIGLQTLDHVALTRDLAVVDLCSVSNLTDDRTLLSDHFGIALSIAARVRD